MSVLGTECFLWDTIHIHVPYIQLPIVILGSETELGRRETELMKTRPQYNKEISVWYMKVSNWDTQLRKKLNWANKDRSWAT